jgi:hypothetical protein
MSVAVNPYLVTTGDDLAQPAWIALYLFAADEESSVRLSSFHDFEEGAEALIGSVIESQCHRVVGRLDPNELRKE